MPTHIVPIGDNGHFHYVGDTKITIPEFYCKESPAEVLESIGKKFHVPKYKDLEYRFYTHTVIKRKDTKNEFHFNGLEVNEFVPENGLAISGSINDYNIPVPEGNPMLEKEEEILKGFVRKYLFDIKEPFPILTNWQRNHFERSFPKGYPEKIKVENYFKRRKKKQNKEEIKEKHLKQIIEYSNLVFGNNFKTIKSLEELSEKVDKNISREWNPYISPNDFLF
jgi:hypothetical protein